MDHFTTLEKQAVSKLRTSKDDVYPHQTSSIHPARSSTTPSHVPTPLPQSSFTVPGVHSNGGDIQGSTLASVAFSDSPSPSLVDDGTPKPIVPFASKLSPKSSINNFSESSTEVRTLTPGRQMSDPLTGAPLKWTDPQILSRGYGYPDSGTDLFKGFSD